MMSAPPEEVVDPAISPHTRSTRASQPSMSSTARWRVRRRRGPGVRAEGLPDPPGPSPRTWNDAESGPAADRRWLERLAAPFITDVLETLKRAYELCFDSTEDCWLWRSLTVGEYGMTARSVPPVFDETEPVARDLLIESILGFDFDGVGPWPLVQLTASSCTCTCAGRTRTSCGVAGAERARLTLAGSAP